MNVAILPHNDKLAVSIVTYFKTAGKVGLYLKFKYGTEITEKLNIKNLKDHLSFSFSIPGLFHLDILLLYLIVLNMNYIEP